MATFFEPTPRPRGSPGPGNPLRHVLAAIEELKRLALDHVELATAEAQRAARGFVVIVCAAIIVAVLAFTAWNAIVAAVVLTLVERDMSWTVALLGAAALHLAAAASVVLWIRSRVPEVVFSATVRQIRADAGDLR